MKIDALIVGQGVAGTLLAHELEQRGQRVVVIDSGEHNASLTAAGMVNPVVLKRFTPVWQGRAQILRAREVMASLSEKLAVKLDYRFDIFRLFHDEKEKQTWRDKADLPMLDGLLDSDFYPVTNDNIIAPFGLGKVHLGGRMDLHALLAAYRHYLSDAGRFVDESFDHDSLIVDEDCCRYGDISARYVVFCEGYGLKRNPYFNHLPLNGNKGEVLTVRIPNLQLTAAIKSSVFLMPLPEQGDDVYFIGATYNWTDKDNTPTEAGKKALLDKLKKILSKDCYDSLEIIGHNAGMRPTVADRRPLLGQHDAHKNLFILNGLGTRGVMLGATMAPHLSAFILDDTPLPAEVDIARFNDLL